MKTCTQRNRFARLNASGAVLLALLQRTPAPTLLAGAGEAVLAADRTLVLLRSVVIGTGMFGAVDSFAGATQFVQSEGSPVRGRVGEPLAVAFSVIASPSAPTQFVLLDHLPPGLGTYPETVDGVIASGTPVILGTPNEAGVFAVRVTAFAGRFRRTDTLWFEIVGTDSVPEAAGDKPVKDFVPRERANY